MSNQETNAIARLLEAFGESQYEANKAKRTSEYKQQETAARIAAQQAAKANDPQQRYLQRRAREENPLMEMVIPEAGQGDDQGGFEMQMPAERVQQNSSGKLESKPINETDKSRMFLQKLDQMLEEGRQPHPAALKVAEKMRERLNKKLGYASPKTAKAYKPNSVTQKALLGLAEFRTQEEALQEVNDNEQAYMLAGVDTDYIKQRIAEVLPEAYDPGQEAIPAQKKKFGIFGKEVKGQEGRLPRRKKGGRWYEKRNGYWEPIDAESDTDTLTGVSSVRG